MDGLVPPALDDVPAMTSHAWKNWVNVAGCFYVAPAFYASI
jgi:hypothetical protein